MDLPVLTATTSHPQRTRSAAAPPPPQLVARCAREASSGCPVALMSGPPGSGKTMLARRITGILPPLSHGERIEVTKVHSAGGEVNGSLLGGRPFRAPHHTISTAGLAGGGSNPRPGEVSLAHLGVIFLD